MSLKCKRVVYAFPHAGAGAAVYRPWVNLVQDAEKDFLQPVEIPGRGKLAKEPEIQCLDALVNRLAEDISADFRWRQGHGVCEWATFGHSFGGVLSVAVSNALKKSYGISPIFSVVSGSIAPSTQEVDNLHEWTDEQILQKAKEDQGTPSIVLNEPTLARRVVTQMRNAYIIRSQFVQLTNMVVDHPLTLVLATDDPHVPDEKVMAWKNHTSKGTSVMTIEGDHFAVYQYWDLIKQELLRDAEYNSFVLAKTNME